MRVVPRAAVALMAGAALGAGQYELFSMGSISTPEQRERIEACAQELGSRSIQLAADDVPGACNRFQIEFSYEDTTVKVVLPDKDGVPQSEFHSERVYTLPAAQQFREAEVADLEDSPTTEEVNQKIGLFMGGFDALLIFGALTMHARAKRRKEAGDEPWPAPRSS